jgi:glycerol-3-phosphate dehydrogenase
VQHLLDRYGSEATTLLEMGRETPDLLEPLEGAEDYLRAEVVFAVTHEGALHLDDVLARRTRMSIEYGHRGVRSARAVAELVAPVLGWDAERVEAEVRSYTERVAAERASQELPDDEAADAARREAPDSRPSLTA